jgi:hypothetical protein
VHTVTGNQKVSEYRDPLRVAARARPRAQGGRCRFCRLRMEKLKGELPQGAGLNDLVSQIKENGHCRAGVAWQMPRTGPNVSWSFAER